MGLPTRLPFASAIHEPGEVSAKQPSILAYFSMPPGADEPVTALFDLSVDDIVDLGGAREAVDPPPGVSHE